MWAKRDKREKTVMGSLGAAIVLYLGYLISGEGSILAFMLVSLLVSFVCAMMLLTDK